MGGEKVVFNTGCAYIGISTVSTKTNREPILDCLAKKN
jgi:hypothetical protein